MDSGSESAKKINLEDLPKNELIKRCKNLLVIAQKAKQAKDVLQEEINNLRTEVNPKENIPNDVGEEIIESLTQKNLSLEMKIEDFKHKVLVLENKLDCCERENQTVKAELNSLQNENISYKRQCNRVTEENEELLLHLESLEKQIDKLNHIGSEQQKQLLALEKSELEYHNQCPSNETADTELKKGGEKELISIQDLTKENEILNTEILQVKKSNEQLEDTVKSLQDANIRQKEKLKLFHSKLIKFAVNVKSLKQEKNDIIHMFKSYTDQVKEWKEQLQVAGVRLVNVFENENSDLNVLKKLNNELTTKLKMCEEKQAVVLQEKVELEKIVKSLTENISILKEEISICNQKTIFVTEEKHHTLSLLQDTTAMVEKQKSEIEDLKQNLNCYQDEIERLKSALCMSAEENNKIKQAHLSLEHIMEENKKERFRVNELLQVQEIKLCSLNEELSKSKLLEKQFGEKSSEEISKLVQENKDLNQTVTKLKSEIDKMENLNRIKTNCETQMVSSGRFSDGTEAKTNNLQRENSELLGEMNEMNQALKERGETISKLEAHCEEIKKKLQFYEMQANKNVDSITEKEQTIRSLTQEIESLRCNTKVIEAKQLTENQDEVNTLRAEIEHLKDKLNASFETSYSECDAMSSSTISRVEESSRLKDLDSSWEERYGKLRNLAVKLKGKIREQGSMISTMQLEKEESTLKLMQSAKSIQILQAEFDKQQDSLDTCNKERKECLDKLGKVAEQISKDKQLLVSYEETIAKLEKNVEDLKSEKQSTETWKKQVSAKVQTLRKELEAQKLMKKELDSQINKLTSDLELKEKELKQEIENHKQTKNLLDRSTNECKKNSVLNLEMQDYERSIKDLSQKLDKKNDELESLQTQLESQKSTTTVLREQNKILEERLQNEELNFTETSQEANTYKKKLVELEDIIQQKEEKITSVFSQLENVRSENEELSTELSKLITEHQKTINSLHLEKDHLRSQVLGLQQSLREVQDSLKLKEDEIKIMQNEYESYKVRAQSVLRQNQNRNVGLEEKLIEEVATLKTQNSSIAHEVAELSKKTELLKSENGNLLREKENYVRKCEELENSVQVLQTQYSELSTKHQKTLSEHAETVRSLKVHADTLSQCYRQQISEQEVRHNREIIELQSKVEKAPSPTEHTSPIPPITLREEGEGSESIESHNQNVHPVPLERLLLSDLDQKMDHLKKQLSEQESKVAHLTALLSDTEQDLVKHVQMNKMLKEEIRRQQRSVEREEHAENLEYLKNVIFKFITLNSGDERVRLVPVLNTILKLSPEETHKLNLVAKAESGIKGWGNYLPPLWSSPNKPQ